MEGSGVRGSNVLIRTLYTRGLDVILDHRTTPVHLRHLTYGCLVAGLILLAGCGGDFYRRSADAQVYKLLAERKKAVLDYRPDTTVAATSEVAVPERAYEKIPATPKP